MPNALQRSAAWFGGKLQAIGGRSVVYFRGTHEIPLTITPYNEKCEAEGEDGIQTGHQVFSWTVTASELVLNDVRLKPEKGDQIVETLNGQATKWDVMPPNESEEPWEWLDTSEILMAVHTKRVE